MQLRLSQVEQFMNALGQPVRYQPIDEIKAEEIVDRLDKLVMKLEDLGLACGVQQVSFARWRFSRMSTHVEREQALLALSEIMYLILGTYHSLGLAPFANSALTMVHNSNMTRRWPDGKIHRDASTGLMAKPPSFVPPDMHAVLSQHREANPFKPSTPPEVIDDNT